MTVEEAVAEYEKTNRILDESGMDDQTGTNALKRYIDNLMRRYKMETTTLLDASIFGSRCIL